jgi:hypothetical protein
MKPYTGTTGTYKFTPADHNGFNAADIRIVIDHNGVWETLPKQ